MPAVVARDAGAVTTRTWVTTTYQDFDAGDGKGVLVSSLGQVTTGHASRRVELPAALAFSAVTAPDGTIYVGTGNAGEVWAVPPGAGTGGATPRRLAKVDGAVLIASLALAPDGSLYAGTVPGGRVVAIDSRSGTVRTVASLPGAEHVWALAWDGARRTLYAATGPQGKLFGIDEGGHARTLWDSGEKQLLSMAIGDDGAVYLGSADDAILYRVDPTSGQVRALHDFEGDEIRAIALHDGSAYVAVNQFERQKGSVPALAPRDQKDTGTRMTEPSKGPGASSPEEAPLPRPGAQKGKGAVFRVDADGRVEQLHALAEGYFTSLAVDADGTVWAGGGSSGKGFEIRPDRTVLTALDLPERQLLAITPATGGGRVVATGDAAALYFVSAGPPADATYTSKAFDAEFVSRWGTIDWHGEGALHLETRSGNTAAPDKTWSAWQAPLGPTGVIEGSGKVASPSGRYLQYRVQFPSGPAKLRDVTVYYLPQNQSPMVSEIQVGDAPSSRTGGPVTTSAQPHVRSSTVRISWKVNDPDGDDLVYRLYVRQEGELDWRPLGPTDPLTHAEYEWDTSVVPDGRYEIRVVASDERSNPSATARTSERISSPYLVDNRKPEVADLKVTFPSAVGRARDSFSRIAEISYAVDGGEDARGEYRLVYPKDGIYDDPVEEFEIQLDPKLSPGVHTLSVRAADEAGNIGAAQLSFRVPPR